MEYFDEFELSDHADCCGRSHIFGFPDKMELRDDYGLKVTDRMLNRSIKEILKGIRYHLFHPYPTTNISRIGHVVEVTLTDNQAKLWEPSLLKYGFEKVIRFKNHRSGNFVNVYLVDVGAIGRLLR